MRVAIAGATGYVGSLVGPRLAADGHEVTVLVHRTRPSWAAGLEGVRETSADVRQLSTLRDAFADHEGVINLVGILRERRGQRFEDLHVGGTRNVVEAATEAGVARYVHMSANGAGRAIPTAYMRTKEAAEALVRKSRLDWTILRPSFILGPGGDMQRLLGRLVAPRIAPVVGGGRYPVAPIDGRDVALAFSRALTNPKAVGRTYALCGPETVEFHELLHRAAAARGHRVRTVPAPRWSAMALAATLGRVGLFPATPDMLRMLIAGNACHEDRYGPELGIEPRPLDEALAFLFGPAGG